MKPAHDAAINLNANRQSRLVQKSSIWRRAGASPMSFSNVDASCRFASDRRCASANARFTAALSCTVNTKHGASRAAETALDCLQA